VYRDAIVCRPICPYVCAPVRWDFVDARYLTELVIVLGTAAVTTILFQALRQPVVLGYILAGLVIGPHVPIPLVADVGLVHTLSELGVILLMFSIGLEFSIRTIAKVGLPAGLTAATEVGLMITIGYLIGYLFGWTATERLFLGACLGISSTMMVAKAFEDLKPAGGFIELVFAILVFEDLIAMILLAVLTAVAQGQDLSAGQLAEMVGRLAAFLAAMLVGGLLVVPRLFRLVISLKRTETLLIASLGTCFAMAVIAERSGYSVALGAFLAGMLIAESNQGHEVEHVIRPFRDVFAAIFFVSVGMTIDPSMLAEHWLPILVVSAVIIVGKFAGVTIGAFLSGNGLRRSVQAGMSLGQIGEFSFIIAALGASTGAIGDHVFPIAVAASCVTSFATPWMIRASAFVASRVDHGLPGRLQTLVTFYGSWIDRLRAAPRRESLWTRLRSPLFVLLLDATMFGAVVIGAALAESRLVPELAARADLDDHVARAIFLGVASVVAGLFAIGVVRCVRKLARTLAREVVPPGEDGKLDLGTAPRRVLFLTLELAITLVVGLPLAAVVAPFLPQGGALLAVIALLIALALWRSTSSLHGHVRAGSELIVEALARQAGGAVPEPAQLAQVEAMLPGFAGLSQVHLSMISPAIGRSLAQLDLRAQTGASVLAITREDGGTAFPTAGEVLRAGDVLALAGSDEAVAAARALLVGESLP